MSTAQTAEGTKPTHGVPRVSYLVDKIAELTGFCRRTVLYWVSREEVDYFRTQNGSVRIYVDSLKDKHWRKVRAATEESAAVS